MGLVDEDSITCPGCKVDSRFQHYTSVNVTLDPELRAQVFTRKLSHFRCEHCGEEATVDHDLRRVPLALAHRRERPPNADSVIPRAMR
jgi:hypothetical protein